MIGSFTAALTGVSDQQTIGSPISFRLEQNFPNPFNPTTSIKYQIPNARHVTLKVFNTIGQEVATVVDEDQESGYKSVQFNGAGLSSGVYFYRLPAGGLS